MSPAGRAIWRRIIASKPIDWFDADQLESLAGHCEVRATFNQLARRLAAEDVESKAFRDIAINMKMIGPSVASSARQLRLTVQNTTDSRKTKLSERGSAMSGDDLVGVAARRIRAVK
jgi:hypothetical protein